MIDMHVPQILPVVCAGIVRGNVETWGAELAARCGTLGNVLVAKALDFHLIIAACESSTCAVL
jgi:hypothetical protein